MKTLLLLAATCCLLSCTKYKEGPMIHLSSSKARITDCWTLTETIKGNSIIQSSGSISEEFHSDGRYEYSYPGYPNQVLEWQFTDNNTKVNFKGSSTHAGAFDYVVLKLTNSEFWYYVDNGQGYHCEYHLSK